MSDNERHELGERIAKLEGLLENHEKNAIDRRVSIDKQFDLIFQKFSQQSCQTHQSRMERLEKDSEDNSGRLRFLEKAYYVGVGALTVLMALLKWVIK